MNYVTLRKPYCVNNVFLQELLLDRRLVLKVLDCISVPTPFSFISQINEDLPNVSPEVVRQVRSSLRLDLSCQSFESDAQVARMIDRETIKCGGKILKKPFVEKPVSGEDHNINIYYTNGGRRLFRKIGNKSSEFDPNLKEIREGASFIYEEFMSVENLEDVKVYTIGKNYAHAETRKSPVVDGIVRRNAEGKEIRYVTPLTEFEREIAKRITVAFGQSVCGFDLLRVNEKSYVIDVNGWSFVKGNDEYYTRCSEFLKQTGLDYMAEKNSTRRLFKVPSSKIIERPWELKAFLSVLRHGDRTPKQKMKLSFKSKTFIDLLNGGFEEVVLKKADELDLILVAAKKAQIEGNEDAVLLQHLIDILQLKSSLPGTKVQVKPVFRKNDLKQASDLKVTVKVQLIVKWGGGFTHGGEIHSRDLAENLRKDLMIINKEMLKDVKVYSSSEGRVTATAEIFSKALLDIPEIPPKFLIVSKEMLDDSNAAKEQLDLVKRKLQMILSPITFTESQLTSPTSEMDLGVDSMSIQNQILALKELIGDASPSATPMLLASDINEAMDVPSFSLDLSNLLEEMIEILQCMRRIMSKNYENKEIDEIQPIWCCNENPNLFRERWEKLFRDICDVKRTALEPSKVSELYDSLKYDLIHNRKFIDVIFYNGDRELVRLLYAKSKNLFDFIGPREYGIDDHEKFEIGQLSASVLIHQIISDLKNARDADTPQTRLYFTKESKVICLLNIILNCGLSVKSSAVVVHSVGSRTDSQTSLNSSVGAADFYELDYLTQITFELYERNNATDSSDSSRSGSPTKEREYSLRIGFSPGAHDANLIDLVFDFRHSLSVAPRKWITDHIKLDEAVALLLPEP